MNVMDIRRPLLARLAQTVGALVEMDAKGLLAPEDVSLNGEATRREWECLLRAQSTLLVSLNTRMDAQMARDELAAEIEAESAEALRLAS